MGVRVCGTLNTLWSKEFEAMLQWILFRELYKERIRVRRKAKVEVRPFLMGILISDLS